MNNSINTIQSLWIGPSLGNMEIICIRSYLQQGHTFHLYIYDEVKNIPEGTIVMDANTIIPQSEIYVDAFGGFVNLSNLFRYTLLYKRGGWWVDMDTVCLKYFDFTTDYVFSSEYSDPYNRFMVNTTFIKSPPGAQFLLDCINFSNQRGHDNIHWGELGVNLISRMIFTNGLQEYVKPYYCFCPFSAHQVDRVINPPTYQPPPESYALHWWHEVWKRRELDKNSSFPASSCYETMKRICLES